MKFLSDVECYPEKKSFSVEWESEAGGRWWECFQSEDEMNDVIMRQQYDLIWYTVNDLILENPEAYIRLKTLFRPNWRAEDKATMKVLVDEHNQKVINWNKKRKAMLNPGAASFTLGEIFKKF